MKQSNMQAPSLPGLCISNPNEIQMYFDYVLKQARSGNKFPIGLDMVWPLAYSRKEEAVRVLKSDFIEGEDYIILEQGGGSHIRSKSNKIQNTDNQFLRKNVGKSKGRPSMTYYLSVACLEYFIVKKVKPVFEVYRQVFHKAAEARRQYTQGRLFEIQPQKPANMPELLRLIKQYLVQGDQLDVAKEIGVAPQTIVGVLNGSIKKSPRILTALYNRALHNKRNGLVIGDIKQAISKLLK